MSQNKLEKFKKPFVVIGLGKSGMAAVRLLKNTSLTAVDVLLFDEKKDGDLKSWDDIAKLTPGTLVVSPGVPLKGPHIQKLLALGWGITSEISLACQFLTDEKVIGITGSVAKSTVTSLVGAALIQDDPKAFVGGNLGVPFCEYAVGLQQGKSKAKYIVLELSSYQLENCKDLKLENSAITYLSANHLERYNSSDEYYMTKCLIGQITKNICVLNSASEDNVKYASRVPGRTLLTQAKTFAKPELLPKVKLLGAHNKDNFSVAYELVKATGLSEKAILAMCEFTGLSHRIEFVAEHNQVSYINDSKATAMDSVLVAVQAAQEKAGTAGFVYSLLGGKDKNLPWEELKSLAKEKQIQAIFFGACGELAREKMQMLDRPYFTKLNDALDVVFKKTKAHDVVLLSPGGTSLDEFKNFEERGNFFKEKVKTFIQQNG
ncbi:MAG: UDP-N-acetylmuramoyl-L-alanine--D-glutamate ligase [Bdellovibrionota bacterium]